jgi:glycerol-1-phosphate dehydrogenase [NAD(P)+]
VLAHSDALLAGDLGVMRHLVRTLVLSGFGMTISNGSFPASQGEHLLSHYVEMMRAHELPHSFHGEQIAVCTVAMAALQEQILARDTPPQLHPSTVERDDVVRHFGPVVGDACWRELELKRFDAAATEVLNARLAQQWDDIRARIASVGLGATTLRSVLAAAGAPIEPRQLGWSAALFEDARHHAREIRNRYTFLDLAADSSPL